MLRRLAASRGLRVGVALLAVALGLLAFADRWPEVRRAAAQLSVLAIGAAYLAVLVGLGASMLSWRVLLRELGSPVPLRPAARVFFLGQLGKYLPGSVWSVVGQVELARDLGVPRARSAAAALLALVVALTAGLAIAAGTLPLLAPAAAGRFWPALAGVPAAAALLHPRVLNAGAGRLLRLAGRRPLERQLTGRGVGAAVGWSLLGWAGYGVQAAALGADLGARGPRALVLALGAFALAWTVGFLVVVAPAGLGVREAALVAGLAPVLPAGPALVVAVVSRALMTLGDLGWAAVAWALGRTRPPASGSRPGPDAPTTPDDDLRRPGSAA